MGCCYSAARASGGKPPPKPSKWEPLEKRGCTDVIPLTVFIIYVVGMVTDGEILLLEMICNGRDSCVSRYLSPLFLSSTELLRDSSMGMIVTGIRAVSKTKNWWKLQILDLTSLEKRKFDIFVCITGMISVYQLCDASVHCVVYIAT